MYEVLDMQSSDSEVAVPFVQTCFLWIQSEYPKLTSYQPTLFFIFWQDILNSKNKELGISSLPYLFNNSV